jgi:hypothetical protein
MRRLLAAQGTSTGTSYAEPDSSADRNKTHLTQRKKQNMTDHSLTLGSLLLTGSVPDADHDFTFDVLADGATFGVAQGVQEVVRSLLADGDLYRITRYGNREVSFRVQIEGPSLGSLAHGEAALRAEVGRPNLLTWQPPDALSVPTVFEVVASEMAQTFDDLDELKRRRVFVVTLTCGPFARSADAVTVDALDPPPGSVTTVAITDADAVTGWSANAGGSAVGVTDQGSYVQATFPSTQLTIIYTPAAPVSLGVSRYILLEMSGSTPTYFSVDGGSGAVGVTPISARATTSGTVVYVLDVGPSFTLHGLSVARKGALVAGAGQAPTLNVHDVTATDTLPQVSPRQITRIIEVGGTERTPASIHVQSEDGVDDLGLIIVHTCPEDGSGYSPPLQRWRTVGQARTDDATAFSGTYESINVTSWVAEVPTSALPEGGYTLLARLRAQSAATVTVTWSTSTIFPDATTQEGFTVGTVQHTFDVGNVWNLVKMEALTLPSVRTQAGKVQIALQVAAASPVVTLDEAWLFRVDDDCALTIVETERPHLWLDSPDLTSPVPRIWVGDGLTTKVHPGEGLHQMGSHVLSPEGTAVFTAALTDNPLTEATFYRRAHSNAAS